MSVVGDLMIVTAEESAGWPDVLTNEAQEVWRFRGIDGASGGKIYERVG